MIRHMRRVSVLLATLVSTISCQPYLIRYASSTTLPISSGAEPTILGYYPFDGSVENQQGTTTLTSTSNLEYGESPVGTGIDVSLVSAESGLEDSEPELLSVVIPGLTAESASLTVAFWTNLFYLNIRAYQSSIDPFMLMDRLFEFNTRRFGPDNRKTSSTIRVPHTWSYSRLPGVITDIDTWHHLAIVVDHLASCWIFVDGDLAVSATASARYDPHESSTTLGLFMAGYDSETGIDRVDVRFLIDELIIFRGILSGAEIGELAAGTLDLSDYPVSSSPN